MIRVAMAVALGVLLGAPAAQARVAIVAPSVATTGELVRLSGRASRPGRVTLERRTSAGWRRAGSPRAARARRFRLRWRAPAAAGVVTLRVVSARAGASRPRRIAVAAVHVVRASSVLTTPPQGRPGVLRSAAHVHARPGEFVAIGAGPATPSGFLGRVLAQRSAHGETVLETRPATLAEAIPEGRLAAGAAGASVAAARSRRSFGAPLACGPGAGATVDGSLAASVVPRFALSWSHRRVRSARAAATVRGDVDLGVEVAGGGVCTLGPLPVATWNAPPLRFFAGPIPVVVVPRTTLYVSADAQAAVPVATRVHGDVSATAGLRYDGAVHPVGRFSQRLVADPPTARTQATVTARLTPSVELLLYGQAGPRVDLGTGLQLDASPDADPWWELSVPVELSAGLRVPGLDLAPRTVLSRNIPLAGADGAAHGPDETGAERARITWDSPADVDLHVWDAEGRHTWYRESGIPGVLLSKDDTNGFGPETFEESGSPGRAFTYGLCYFDARGAGATTVSVKLTDPGGAVRDSTHVLAGEGDSVLVGSSPPGAAGAPRDGWCQGRH